jgi:hypothetical protein
MKDFPNFKLKEWNLLYEHKIHEMNIQIYLSIQKIHARMNHSKKKFLCKVVQFL